MKSLYVEEDPVSVPGPCSNRVGDYRAEEPVEVEEEEDGEQAGDEQEDEEFAFDC